MALNQRDIREQMAMLALNWSASNMFKIMSGCGSQRIAGHMSDFCHQLWTFLDELKTETEGHIQEIVLHLKIN
jgi:hypothetical protein